MASLGIDTVKHAAHLREPDNQGTYFFFAPFFFRPSLTGGRVGSFVRGGESQLRTRGKWMIGSRSVYGKAPMGQVTF